jgi:hypothetical protein
MFAKKHEELRPEADDEGDAGQTPVRAGPSLQAAIAVCLVAVVGLGLYPRPLVEEAAKAASAFMHRH